MQSRLLYPVLFAAVLGASGCQEAAPDTSVPKPPGAGVSDKAGKKTATPAAAPAPSEEEKRAARTIVDRGVEAMAGGSERLQKLRHYVLRGKGVLYTAGGELNPVREIAFRFPDAMRIALVHGEALQGRKDIMVLKGITGWMQKGEMPREPLSSDAAVEFRNVAYAYWVATLIPLQDVSAPIAALKEGAAGKGMTAIKLRQPGRPEITLFFDAATGLPARLMYRDSAIGVKVKELRFSEYKEFGGLKLPTVEVELHDGRKMAEWTNSEYQFPEKLDDAALEKPTI